jgi:hypothetical protein
MGLVPGTLGSIEAVRASLFEQLCLQRPEIEKALVARVRNVASDRTANRDVLYEEGQRTAVVAALDYALSDIEHGEGSDTPIPSEIVAQARRAASAGVGLDIVLRRYTAGYALLGDFVMQAADRGDLLCQGAAMRGVQRTQAALLDRLIASINDEYARELQRTGGSPEQCRAERVRQLLADDLVDTQDLGYELDAWHLGMIGTGTGAEGAIRGMASKCDCSLLCVSHDEQNVWAWLGGQRKVMAEDITSSLALRWPEGVSLAIGEPARGLGGWRQTHWQAQDALLVSLRQPRILTLYVDVALLAPWLQDEARAQWLMEMHLSPLDNYRCPGSTLRKTLRAYFAAGRNASAAALVLNVSRRTMRNRMVLIEEGLGRHFNERQAELELALRLEALKVAGGGSRE